MKRLKLLENALNYLDVKISPQISKDDLTFFVLVCVHIFSITS